MSLAVLLLAGCGGAQEAAPEEERYIGVYEEIEQTQAQTAASEPPAELPAVYTYNYFDHLLIAGDDICGGMTSRMSPYLPVDRGKGHFLRYHCRGVRRPGGGDRRENT